MIKAKNNNIFLFLKIKLMHLEKHYWNPKYMSALEYFVTPYNRTYNNLGLHWVVTRDLPVDISVSLIFI